MRTIFLLLGLISCQFTAAQDIVSTPFIVDGIIELGESASVQFTVDQETTCDNYMIGWDINYTAKIININLDYNYVSTCGTSIASFVEIPANQLLLLGTYHINLNLNVPANPTWNRTFALGSVFVIGPTGNSCSSANIPVMQNFCPTDFNEVCACNGVTYDNECIAYLEEENGVFVETNCLNYLESNEQIFECLSYNSNNNSNFFEQYGCANEDFRGDELIFRYTPPLNTPNTIIFTSSANDVKLFLIRVVNNNLECISSSELNVIEHGSLEDGVYYLIADRIESSDFMVSFCENPTSVVDLNESETVVYPNPANNEINISNPSHKIKEIKCYNSLGQLKLKKIINDHQLQIPTTNFKGVYFLNILYNENSAETIKVIFE